MNIMMWDWVENPAQGLGVLPSPRLWKAKQNATHNAWR